MRDCTCPLSDTQLDSGLSSVSIASNGAIPAESLGTLLQLGLHGTINALLETPLAAHTILRSTLANTRAT